MPKLLPTLATDVGQRNKLSKADESFYKQYSKIQEQRILDLKNDIQNMDLVHLTPTSPEIKSAVPKVAFDEILVEAQKNSVAEVEKLNLKKEGSMYKKRSLAMKR